MTRIKFTIALVIFLYLYKAFSDTIKHSTYQKQNGICVKCNEHFDISEMEADHITPWSEGGKTIA